MTPLQVIESEMELTAKADYSAHVGRVLLVTSVTGYNEHDDSVDVFCEPPARMRVEKTRTEDIHHWNDNWLDPYWDVSLIGTHPALKGIRSMWVFGPSYCTDGRTEPSSDWSVEETSLIQKIKDAWESRR